MHGWNAFHLVRIREGDEWKTLGHFKFLIIHFQLTNVPAVFQNLVNDILRDFLNRFVFGYLNLDFFFGIQEEHTGDVRQVFQRLLENNCFSRWKNVNFLGFSVESGQVKADPEKIKAVEEWPVPENRFILDYSRVVAPLTG